MGSLELLLIALGLSLDSFAVSVCTGMTQKRVLIIQAVKMAVVLGLIQGFAPVLGGWFGLGVKSLIQQLDHWIALLLLSFIGGKMVFDGIRNKKTIPKGNLMKMAALITMGLATSVDAVVVGVSFGLVGVALWKAGLIIGLITFIAVFFGVFLGVRFSGLVRMRLEIIAGIVLIGLGVRIFVEHMINNI
ncbi:MAG: manganese efflux pump [Bacteroidota bacterium]|nr:manganese efflux pump [Bacteroidota bacterium]